MGHKFVVAAEDEKRARGAIDKVKGPNGRPIDLLVLNQGEEIVFSVGLLEAPLVAVALVGEMVRFESVPPTVSV